MILERVGFDCSMKDVMNKTVAPHKYDNKNLSSTPQIFPSPIQDELYKLLTIFAKGEIRWEAWHVPT